MIVRRIKPEDRERYNETVDHVIQSWEWGEFRRKTGVKVIRLGKFDKDKLLQGFQLTIHAVPFTKCAIAYLPKGPVPDKQMLKALEKIGKKENCVFIKLEPNIQKISNFPARFALRSKAGGQFPISNFSLIPSPKPLFTKHNFLVGLTKSEEELLRDMKAKTRYNIRLAQRKGVEVKEKKDKKSFEIYIRLYFETCQRQKYFGHNRKYHRLMWETLKPAGMVRLLIASYKKEPLVAWMLLKFKDTLYYPYGGSSLKHKNFMASNLICWEAMKLGKKLGCQTFDMWGALGPDSDKSHPWYGWNRFKAGYGGKLVEYVGSYDLVLKPTMYKLFNLADQMRWKYLRLKTLLPF